MPAPTALDGGGGGDVMYGFEGNDRYFVDGTTGGRGCRPGRRPGPRGRQLHARRGPGLETLTTDNNRGTTAIDLTGNGLPISSAMPAPMCSTARAAADLLIGYGGADSFAFTTALGARQCRRDRRLRVGDDKIVLDDAVFAGIGLGRA